MNTFNETFEKLTEMQKQGLEPVRQFNSMAVELFEQIARKNYAFYGDVLEFAVAQADGGARPFSRCLQNGFESEGHIGAGVAVRHGKYVDAVEGLLFPDDAMDARAQGSGQMAGVEWGGCRRDAQGADYSRGRRNVVPR